MDYDCNIIDSRNKRKHVTLTIQEKLEIINLVESGKETRQNIANRYGIGKSTVHDIHKRRSVIKSFALQNSSELSKRRRVDIKMETKAEDQLMYKDESNEMVEEEETLVENFDHEEFDYNEQEYEIVYEPILCSSREIDTKPLIEIAEKSNQENSAKRKSKTLTLKEKYDILVQLDEGKAISTIISKYGIGRTTLYDLKKQKQKIFEYMENCSGETRRTFKKSNYPEIENSLLEWCGMRDYYTEHQFFEKYKQLFTQRKSSNSSVQTSGSWSWCKRFFDRNPEYKRKLITTKGMNDSYKAERIKSDHNVKLFYDSDNIMDDKNDFIKNSLSRRIPNYLTLNDKAQVIDDSSVDKWNISKSTIYDILRKESEKSNGLLNSERKTGKSPCSPEIEKELVEWCHRQESLPSHVSISNKANSIYDSMNVKTDFNPTSNWAKKFIERHPELVKKNDEEHGKNLNDSSFSDVIEEDHVNSIENIQEESLEFIEPDFLKSDSKVEQTDHDEYGNEYIIEELDDDNDNALEAISYEDQQEGEREVINKRKQDSIVSDIEAINSLKVLIKYSEQKGHDEISALLLEYQNILLDEGNI